MKMRMFAEDELSPYGFWRALLGNNSFYTDLVQNTGIMLNFAILKTNKSSYKKININKKHRHFFPNNKI
jgi:hypothetical protein